MGVRCICTKEGRWKLAGLPLHLIRASGLHPASNRGLGPCIHLPRALICVLKGCQTMETSTLRLNYAEQLMAHADAPHLVKQYWKSPVRLAKRRGWRTIQGDVRGDLHFQVEVQPSF